MIKNNRIKQNKPILYFTISFLMLFLFLMFLFVFIRPTIHQLSMSIANKFAVERVNEERNTRFMRVYLEEPETNYIAADITFFDINLQGGHPTVTIKIDSFTELFIPLVLILALALSLPLSIKKQIYITATGLLILLPYIILKYKVLLFDNYTYEEYKVIVFNNFFDTFLYYANHFFAVTGITSSFIVPILIWIITILIYVKEDEIQLLTKN